MTMNKSLNIIISFSMLVQAAVFQVALPNLVLCFGDDGHVAFELQNGSSQCDHNISVSNIFSFHPENELTEIAGMDCTDIDLHFHLSYTDKIQKKNHPTSSTLILEHFNFRVMEKVPFYSSVNHTHFSPQYTMNSAIKNTVLII